MKHQVVLLLLMCMVLGAISASAQDKGRVGVAMGFPSSIAAIWHVTEAIAIRPEIGLSRSSEEYPSTITTASTRSSTTNTTTILTTTVGVSGVFFVASHDSLRAYLSPRAAYIRRSSTYRTASSSLPEIENTSSGYSAGGSVGAQYAIGRRFSAYGELGVAYEHHLYREHISDDVRHAIATRSAVGVIVYF
jgi:hypothetical protein